MIRPQYPSVAVAILLLSAGNFAVGASRPNVLLIMTDDQGYGDFSVNGHPYLQTPNIDSIAREGTRFDRFFVSSFCAPTRAALLTGRYPERCGVYGVTHNKETMRSREITIAEALGRAGYRTGCFGKWHLGEQYPHTPTGQGFDEFFGIWNGHTNRYFDAVLSRGAKPEPTKGYIADVYTDEAIRFIKEKSYQPFFCYLSFNTPHSPYQVPDRFYDKYANQGLSPLVAAFFAMCENMDENVGRVLAALDEAGVADSTIVLFLTDNGSTSATDIYNAGMRDGKTSVHEGGSRVPLFVRWTGRFPAPRMVKRIAAHIDVYPTILDLCDVELPPEQPQLDGKSLRPLLEGQEDAWADRVLFIHNGISETNRYPGAVRTERYRLVRTIDGPAGGSLAVENDRSATPWQLYDMRDDPAEKKDLAGEHADFVDDLSGKYEHWLDDVLSEGLERAPIPVGYVEHNPVTLSAHQSYFDESLQFGVGRGAAHAHLTGWTDAEGKIWFDVDAHRAGRYEAALVYGCAEKDAGSKIRVTSGVDSLTAEVAAAEAKVVDLPHRDQHGARLYPERDWARQPLGIVKLAPGRQRVTIEVLEKPGESVMDFKGLELRKID